MYNIKPAKILRECRQALDEVQQHLRVLNSLGQDINHNHLRFMIIDKIPQKIIYEMKLRNKGGNIDEMRKQLGIIISVRKEATKVKTSSEMVVGYTVETLHVRNGQENNRTDRNNQQKQNDSDNIAISRFYSRMEMKGIKGQNSRNAHFVRVIMRT